MVDKFEITSCKYLGTRLLAIATSLGNGWIAILILSGTLERQHYSRDLPKAENKSQEFFKEGPGP